jgi:hypothetical protein
MIQVIKNFYHYIQKPKLLGVGNSNYAFEPQFTLPAYDELGISVPAGRMVNVFQNNQVMVYQQVTQAGMGGLFAGQMAQQPLFITPDQQGKNGL